MLDKPRDKQAKCGFCMPQTEMKMQELDFLCVEIIVSSFCTEDCIRRPWRLIYTALNPHSTFDCQCTSPSKLLWQTTTFECNEWQTSWKESVKVGEETVPLLIKGAGKDSPQQYSEEMLRNKHRMGHGERLTFWNVLRILAHEHSCFAFSTLKVRFKYLYTEFRSRSRTITAMEQGWSSIEDLEREN